MSDQAVVIVGPDGSEHEFPAGFDPKRAASIVRQQYEPQAAKPAPVPEPFKSESGFRGIEAIGDAVRAIPDVARNLLNPATRAATLHGAREGADSANRDFEHALSTELGGAKDMAVGVGGMVRHPIDTATGLGRSFLDAGAAIPDIARNTVGVGATAETRKATAKGMGMGLAEGASGVDADQAAADPLRAIGGALALVAGGKVVGSGGKAARGAILKRVEGSRIAAAAKAAETEQMARVAAGLGGDVPPEVVAQGLGEGPKPVPGSKVVDPNSELLTEIKAGIDEGRAAAHGGPSGSATISSIPPSANLAQPAVSYPRVPGRRVVEGTRRVPVAPVDAAAAATEAAAPEVTQTVPPGRDGHFKLPKPKAMLNDAQFADVERRINGKFRTDGGPERRVVAPPAEPVAPKEPGIPTVSKDGQKVVVRPKPGVAADLRRAVGSEKAARQLGVTPEDVRNAAPGPRRRPLAAEIAELDNDYTRRINDERGFVDPKLAVQIGAPVAGAAAGGALANDDHKIAGALVGALTGAAAANPVAAAKRFNELRQIAMLSGGALPKSILGNIGAHIQAAGEMGSAAPLKEMLRVPENFKVAKQGFTAQTAPGGAMTSGAKVEGLGRFNVFGRLMGALDDASTASLERAGVPESRARQLQLMEQNPAGAGGASLQRAFDTRLGHFLVPYQRVPLNQWAQGVESLEGVLPRGDRAPSVHTSGRGRALTAGAVAGGALAGDQKPDPLTLALLAALAGPRALPFAAGAGLAVAEKKGPSAAKSLLERVGVGLPEGALSDLYNPLRAIDKPALFRFIEQMKGAK